MRSNYKKLGQFVEIVDTRNADLEVELLLGVSIQKILIPSIANIVGTKMNNYKVIQNGQFVYGPVTSRNGDKISVALLENFDEAIVSQSYIVFKVTDETKLDPEYLMMWFRRPEFDRYARYMSHGSTREAFSWEEMCDVELPIPSIEKQKEIVAEYKTVTDRIELNQKINKKIEETAKAVYKEWFVEFNFPDENDQPYKKSGGKMVWNEELGKDVPDGWEVKKYREVFDFKTGKLNSNAAVKNGTYPFFTCSSETFKTNTYSFDDEVLLLAGNNASAIYPFKYFKGKFDVYQRTYVIKPTDDLISIYQGYFEILGELEGFKGTSSGTTTKFLTMKILNTLKLIFGSKNITKNFHIVCTPIFQRKLMISKALNHSVELQNLLLSKMSKAGV